MSTGDRKHYTPHEDLTDLADTMRELNTTSEALLGEIKDVIEALSIEMITTKLEISTSQCPAIDIQHSGIYSCKVINLGPTAALDPASTWFAMYMNMAALDPSGAGCQLHGIEIDFSAVDLTHDPDIDGLAVKLPAAYAGGTEVAGYFAGDGRTVSLCTDSYALAISGAMQLDGIITGMNSLQCDLGTSINEFSTDDTLAGDSDDAVPTEQAVKAYVDGAVGTVQTDLDGFQDGLKDLTAIEITQLKNIGISTISPTQWGYLGALDQTLIQASSPTFAGLTVSGNDISGSDGTQMTMNADGVEFQGNIGVGSRAPSATIGIYDYSAGTGHWSLRSTDSASQILVSGATDFDAIFLTREGTTNRLGMLYDASQNDGRIYHYPSGAMITFPDGGGIELEAVGGVLQVINNELDLTGALAYIDLNPAGTGSKNIIDITPSANLVAGSIWQAIYIDMNGLDPATGDGCTVSGIAIIGTNCVSVDSDIDFRGIFYANPIAESSRFLYWSMGEVTRNEIIEGFFAYSARVLSKTATYRGVNVSWAGITRDAEAPVLEGIQSVLPADYTDFGVCFAGYFSGDGRSVTICDTTYALDVSGVVRVVGDVTVDNLITTGNVDGVDVSAHAADSDIHVAHSGVSVIAGTGLSGGGTIAADRTIDCTITQYTDALAIAAVVAENPLTLTNALLIGSIVAGTADYDAFLVSHAGTVKYRTGAQVLSDIGASATGHTHTHASTTGQTANDHHNESHDIASHSDITFTGAQLEDAAFHAGTWMPCNYMGNDLKEVWGTSLSNLSNPTTNNQYLVFQLPLPPVKGALKLYVTGVRVGLFDADGTNYVDEMWVYGIKYTGRTYLTVSDRTVNKNAPGLHEYTMANFDCSTYETVAVEFLVALANVGALDISSVSLLCYYGA